MKKSNKKVTEIGQSKTKSNREEKKETQFVAFRVPSETWKKIKTLEDIDKNVSRTDAIIRSIDNSYNGIIFENVINRIIPIVKKIFTKFKLEQAGFGHKAKVFNEDEPFKITFNEGKMIFDLPDFQCKTNDKSLTCFLNKLILDLEIENSKLIKVEIISPLIAGPVGKLDPGFFKKVHEISVKNQIQVKSHTSKDNIALDFREEDHIHLDGEEWVKYFEKDLNNIKKAIEEIRNEKCFVKS